MSELLLTCPECEEGRLVRGTRDIEFTHNGAPLLLRGLECYRCTLCNTETVKPDQIRRNQACIADAKRRNDGYLTSSEIRALREGLGLSQPDAAQLFGGGANAFSKYERGEVIQSVPMDRLLRLVAAYPWLLGFLCIQAGREPPAAPSGAYVDTQAVYLNDPYYRSRPVHGTEVVASARRYESSVVSLAEWGRTRVA